MAPLIIMQVDFWIPRFKFNSVVVSRDSYHKGQPYIKIGLTSTIEILNSRFHFFP